MSVKQTVAQVALLLCVPVGALSVPSSSSAQVDLASGLTPAVTSDTRAAAASSTDVLISAPRPARLPRQGCATLKFPWAVATDLTDTRIHAGIAIYRNGNQVDDQVLPGMYANRWYYFQVYACQPGRYTVRVDGEIRELSTGDWKVLARLQGTRSFIVRRR